MIFKQRTIKNGVRLTMVAGLLVTVCPGVLQAMERPPACHSGHHINMWSEPKHSETIGVKSGADRRGAELVEAACAHCHGLDGISSDETIPNLAGQEFWYLCESLYAYRKQLRHVEARNGIHESLTDQEILDVSDYFAHLPSYNPKEPRP